MTVYDILPERYPGTRPAVALGLFDGLHRGHLAVLEALRGFACANPGTSSCVFTFSTDRDKPDSKTPGRIISRSARDELLEEMGIDYVFQPEFADFRDMSPETFAKDFLLGYLNASAVFCGENFRFGKGALANADDLGRFLRNSSTLRAIPALWALGGVISATRIREYIRAGDMRAASELLGRPFTIDSPVEPGRRLGRKLDMPTINQPIPEGFIIPRHGVYASFADVGGNRLPAVTNVGVKPTVGSPRLLAETHILGFSGDLYGLTVPVGLVEFIRDERKFTDISKLREQILRDAEAAARITGG